MKVRVMYLTVPGSIWYEKSALKAPVKTRFADYRLQEKFDWLEGSIGFINTNLPIPYLFLFVLA